MLDRFPRLTTIGLSYIAAFMVFAFLGPDFFGKIITPLGIFGIFIAGMLYTYSFTTSIGAILLIPFAIHYPPGLVTVVGGVGSLFGDLTIFSIIRNDLHKEVQRIASSPFMRRLGATPLFRDTWFRDLVGAAVIASPIPDEMGIAIMSSAKINTSSFALLSFIADMIGIYLLVAAVSFIY
jgi:hypothetical protein